MFGMANAVQLTPFTLASYLTPELWLALVAGIIGSAPIVQALGRWRTALAGPWRAVGLAALADATLMLILGASIMQMAARTYNPFIYFRF
jgi:hypothetical protein